MNKKEFNSEDLTCKPLDTYEEITNFLKDPPPWRTLCKDITPHSKNLIKNNEINPCTTATMQMPETFCHFNPDMEDVERHNEKNLSKTLVCHDMANGYHDDSVIDGTGNYNAYTFYNWAGIDIFCYFSHHLITIPPVSWINVGHAHGVKVIGTVITEWAEGITFWDKILSSEVEYQNFASALVAIAKTLKFDGWLLNVENRVTKPDVLLEFVKYLHKTLHQELRDPVLVWYDSVTINGSLNWQNGLNEKNKAFFDVCDAFFTNYSWSESNIKSSAEAAGDRLTDLYIGIDVWGRNFFGGGQFNTAEAVKIAYKYGCSLAIFAPAWTHEAMSLDNGDVNAVACREKADEWATFNLRDRAFWGSIWPFLNTRLPTELPFQTSFCRGQGKKRRLYGEVLCPVPWYNLRHQQYQPNSAHGPHGYIISTVDYILKLAQKEAYKGDQVDNELDETDEPGTSYKSDKSMIQMSVNINLAEKTETVRYTLASVEEEKECLEVYMEDSFTGGTCLCINPSDLFSIEHRQIRLFHCDFECKDSLIACVVTKNFGNFRDQYLKIKLFMKNSKGDDLRVVLIGKNLPQSKNIVGEETGIVNLYPVNLRSQEAFRDLQRYVLLNEPTFYVPVENCYNWKVWYYEINMPGSRVTSVNCQTGLEEGPMLLGHFGLCERFRK